MFDSTDHRYEQWFVQNAHEDHPMRSDGLPEDVDQLLEGLARLPVDALQVMAWFVDALIENPDDDERRKELLSEATTRMSALHSV